MKRVGIPTVQRSNIPTDRGHQEVESWLRARAVPAAEAMKADSSRAFSVDDVRSHLAAKRVGPLRGTPEEEEVLDFIERAAADWDE